VSSTSSFSQNQSVRSKLGSTISKQAKTGEEINKPQTQIKDNHSMPKVLET
jgi:hypothetical protein